MTPAPTTPMTPAPITAVAPPATPAADARTSPLVVTDPRKGIVPTHTAVHPIEATR